jgi:hypothetical protein
MTTNNRRRWRLANEVSDHRAPVCAHLCLAHFARRANQRSVHFNHCLALLRKIFRFPRRANQRYQLAPSFPGKRGGRASSRTWEGMRWTRQRRRATVSQGESLVSDQPACRRTALIPPSLKLRRTGTKPVEAFGVDGCVRQNRVVPTPVAGVKLSVATSIRPDRSSHQAGSDGDKTNSSPGRARHKP